MSDNHPNDESALMPGGGGKTLAFELGGATYGVDVAGVREIIRMVELIPIPRTPDFIRGVMDLRGAIIPVLDLRTILEVERPDDDAEARIVVVESGTHTTGLVVDRVLEVLDIPQDQVAVPPDFGSSVDIGFVRGIGRTPGGIVTLLALNRLLDAEQGRALLQAMDSQAA